VSGVQAHVDRWMRGCRRPIGPCLPICLIATVAIAGCGGDSKAQLATSTPAATVSAEPTTTPASSETLSPSPGKMISSAELICKRLDTELKSARTTVTSFRALALPARSLATLEDQAIRELDALRAPARIVGDWREMMVYRRTVAANLREIARAAQHEERGVVESASISTASAERGLLATARRAGFKYCSRIS
jgi:hypothetical protein